MTKRKTEEMPSFEESLAELETIANDLEEGTIGLDEALARFERGVGLLRHCYAVLESAEGKIAELTGFDAEGNPVLEPFDASATVGQGKAGRRKSGKSGKAKRSDPDSGNDDKQEGGLF